MNVSNSSGNRLWTLVGILALGLGLGGCLGEPPIEERWSNVQWESSDVAGTDTLAVGQSSRISLQAKVRFEDILTGFVVAELRASQSLTPTELGLDASDDPVAESLDVERILAQSATAGRATRATVGFPQLIRTFDLSFDVTVPATVDAVQDPPGGPTQSLFLVIYLAEGEEIRLETGQDSLVVDPFATQEYRVLHKGIAIPLPGAP